MWASSPTFVTDCIPLDIMQSEFTFKSMSNPCWTIFRKALRRHGRSWVRSKKEAATFAAASFSAGRPRRGLCMPPRAICQQGQQAGAGGFFPGCQCAEGKAKFAAGAPALEGLPQLPAAAVGQGQPTAQLLFRLAGLLARHPHPPQHFHSAHRLGGGRRLPV